ncbi:MAG: hypothetical protein ACPG9Q_04830 [Candidatus Thalassarchaeaceae archaeon]
MLGRSRGSSDGSGERRSSEGGRRPERGPSSDSSISPSKVFETIRI